MFLVGTGNVHLRQGGAGLVLGYAVASVPRCCQGCCQTASSRNVIGAPQQIGVKARTEFAACLPRWASGHHPVGYTCTSAYRLALAALEYMDANSRLSEVNVSQLYGGTPDSKQR
jgi:hypothetical protein